MPDQNDIDQPLDHGDDRSLLMRMLHEEHTRLRNEIDDLRQKQEDQKKKQDEKKGGDKEGGDEEAADKEGARKRGR